MLAATGDQFDEADSVIGVVLSVSHPNSNINLTRLRLTSACFGVSQVRAQEDVLSVWTEKAASDGGAKLKLVSFRPIDYLHHLALSY